MGGYFSELFPAHLRSFGAALFHGGRIIGMWVPMVLVFIQERSDLKGTAMWARQSYGFWLVYCGYLYQKTLKGGIEKSKAEAAKANPLKGRTLKRYEITSIRLIVSR